MQQFAKKARITRICKNLQKEHAKLQKIVNFAKIFTIVQNFAKTVSQKVGQICKLNKNKQEQTIRILNAEQRAVIVLEGSER